MSETVFRETTERRIKATCRVCGEESIAPNKGLGPAVIATFETQHQHPALHPAALVLADHLAAITTRAASVPAVCECGWRGVADGYPGHLAEVLAEAGLLADIP